mgnify:CR=1 FL=1
MEGILYLEWKEFCILNGRNSGILSALHPQRNENSRFRHTHFLAGERLEAASCKYEASGETVDLLCKIVRSWRRESFGSPPQE